MKKLFRSLLMAMAVLFLAADVLPAAVTAADPAASGMAPRWNIMLVIDASRSLTHGAGSNRASDKNGLRFVK